MFGLPHDSPLSVLVVEVFGNITSLREHITGLQQPTVRNNITGAFRAQGMEATHINQMNDEMNRAAENQEMLMMATANYNPLTSGLGHYRILRTSPLTEVPFVCCATC